MDMDIDIPDIYDLTNFNTKSTPDLIFTIRTENDNIIVRCNDNIIGTYNNDIHIKHDITDIINNLLYEKNLKHDELCFIQKSQQNCCLRIDGYSYGISYLKLPEFDNILISTYSNQKQHNVIVSCTTINYKLVDLVKYIRNTYSFYPNGYFNITSIEYDEDQNEDKTSINVTIYCDIVCNDIENIIMKETFIKDINMISICGKYIISTKLFRRNKCFRLYIKSITKIDINKTIIICKFNNNNNMTYTADTIRIKENDKYINILDKNIRIDFTQYKMREIKYSYINYGIDD